MWPTHQRFYQAYQVPGRVAEPLSTLCRRRAWSTTSRIASQTFAELDYSFYLCVSHKDLPVINVNYTQVGARALGGRGFQTTEVVVFSNLRLSEIVSSSNLFSTTLQALIKLAIWNRSPTRASYVSRCRSSRLLEQRFTRKTIHRSTLSRVSGGIREELLQSQQMKANDGGGSTRGVASSTTNKSH